jgi:hypothetical protein
VPRGPIEAASLWQDSETRNTRPGFMLASSERGKVCVVMPGIDMSPQTHEWLRQEMTCLLCARHIAFLLVPLEPPGQLTQASATVWLRSMHCATCGGSPVISPGERVYAPKDR